MNANETILAELRKIATQNRAILTNQGHYYVCDAYAWGFTKANGDPFVALYPARKGWKRHICKVYPHQFDRLPQAMVATIPAPPSWGHLEPGDRDEALGRGILVTCQPMGIITVAGQESAVGTERRFYAVDWVAGSGQTTTEAANFDPTPIPTPGGETAQASYKAVYGPANGNGSGNGGNGSGLTGPGVMRGKQAVGLMPLDPDDQLYGQANGHGSAPANPEPEFMRPDASTLAAQQKAEAAALADWAGLYAEFMSLGNKVYGPHTWPDVAARNAERVSDGRTRGPKKLSAKELERLLAGLRKLAAQREKTPA